MAVPMCVPEVEPVVSLACPAHLHGRRQEPRDGNLDGEDHTAERTVEDVFLCQFLMDIPACLANHLILKLRANQMSSKSQSSVLHKFKGVIFSTMSSEELLNSLDSFEAREDDVFLVSYPKSGTHWIAKVIENIPNARITLTPPIELGDISKFEELKTYCERRVIPTHLSYSMLPMNVKQKQCKIIYIIRNPKDIAVSFFHYYRDNPNLPSIETWHEFFELFLKGDVVYGSWFDHVLSWEEHKNAKNILIISYEEMKKDPSKNIKKIATFLSLNMTDSEINQIVWKTSFTEMKNNTAKENCDPNHTICALTSNRNLVFRKGAVGDWINYFTSKQKQVFDELFTEKMKHSELAKHFGDYS
ncbi:sulfotransferase 6B1-like [Bubalus bubalis]|uniref:sulfotransferase 6B1-like n=1 Tax=Bubalus bubalis TaxID=89462 RepID=UPI001E1B6AF5|nr:sulfotransferase 6B1-like [Bubalus bubalis]